MLGQFGDGGVIRSDKVEIMEGKAVMKGLYRDRYGKCESKTEASGELVAECCPKCSVSAEKNDWWRFQMSTKLENRLVRDERSNKGVEVSREVITGVRKCCSAMRRS